MSRNLQFRNNEETYPLDDNWIFDLSSFNRRLDLSSRFSRNGSNVYGDRTTDARTMKFTYQLGADNDQSNIDFLIGLERFFDLVRFPFFFEDVGNGRRARIEVERIESNAQSQGLRKRLENVSLSVIMLDGEYEDLTEREQTVTLASGGQLTITNEGRTIFPILEIESLGSITDFELLNITNSSGFSMSFTSFPASEKIIANGQTGTITRSGVDQSFNIVEGGFISLNPGANILQYGSATGSISLKVRWRQVYAF